MPQAEKVLAENGVIILSFSPKRYGLTKQAATTAASVR